MGTHPFFDWTELLEGDSGGEVILNELAGRVTATLARVKSMTTTAQPGSPANYDAYLLPASPTGSQWSGQGNDIALYLDGWIFITPTEGMRLRVEDDNMTITYDGTVWSATDGLQTLTDAANIAVDLQKGLACEVTLTANRILDNPTNKQEGRIMTLRVVQDTTGSRTLTYGTEYLFAGGTSPTLSTGANAVDVLTFMQHAATMLHLATELNLS